MRLEDLTICRQGPADQHGAFAHDVISDDVL